MANRFVVDLSSVKLPKDTEQRLQAAIQRSVLEVIAGLPHQGDLHIRFPREWIGIVLSPQIDALEGLDKQIGRQINF